MTLSPHALELAQTLARMNTVSHNSNLELIHFIRDHLARLGVKSRLTFNEDKTKANLFATLGEGKPAGVILSGHTDTVPWDGQDWTMDPLSALVKDGNLYGRGSADMKAFIGIAVSHAEQFLNSDAPFAIHLAFSYEEEIGCFGVKELIADLRDANIKPLACIVGEPTSMVPAIAHKGVYRYKCCVRGKEAHSSLTPHSVNAIEMAARVVGRVRDMAEGFENETICEIPSFLGSKDDPVTRLAQELSGEKNTTLVAFGTEAGLFKNAGISTVVCGPGSIQQAHQPDEYVSLEQLARCEAFMQGLARTRTLG